MDLDDERLPALAGRLRHATAFPADLAVPEECERVVADVIRDLGRVDILVNCAAILSRRSLDDASPDHWDHVFAINARAPFFVTRAAYRDMRSRGWGRIVFVTSTGVYEGGFTMTSAAYECSKGAVNVMNKMYAKEGSRSGVLVNALCPGGMRTPMLLTDTPQSILDMVEESIPVGRLAEPVEMAQMIRWLVSDLNTYATGAVFDINGGLVYAG